LLKVWLVGKTDIPAQITQAIFKAAKPVGEKPSILITGLPSGEQVVVSLSKVVEGRMTDADKKQLELGKKNIGNAFGQTEFNAVLNSLEADADISIQEKSKQVVE
jgi:hypothetical protein